MPKKGKVPKQLRAFVFGRKKKGKKRKGKTKRRRTRRGKSSKSFWP